MIRLDTTSRKLTAVLDGGTNGVHYTVAYNDRTASAFGPGASALSVSNATTPVNILAAPSASTTREVDAITARNTSGSSRVVTIALDNSGTGYQLVSVTLAAGSTLQYTHGEGWRVLDTSGQLVTTAGSGGLSDGDKGDVTVSSSGATWTIDNDVVTYAKMQNISATSRVLGRKTAAAGDTEECTLSEVLDFVGSAAQGDILYRGAATWTRLGAGTSGHFLKTQGAGANPTWAAASGSLDITGLTATDPAMDDESPIYDVSALVNKKLTIGSLVGTQPSTPGGRLTLSASLPIADVTPGSFIYYLPYVNDRITLWDGSRWVTATFTGPSAGVPMGSGMYDVFAYLSAGVVTLETATWSSTTARTTAITLQDGRYCKSGSKTRLYLGSFYTPSGTSTDDTTGKRYVWNMYNRVQRSMYVQETTDSWNYTTATWRSANNSTANRVNFIRGLDEDSMTARVRAGVASTGSNNVSAGIGLDSTSANAAQLYGTPLNLYAVAAAEYTGLPGIGLHYFQWLEYSAAAGTTTWYGDAGLAYHQFGLLAEGLF